jgi:hypothetical protein
VFNVERCSIQPTWTDPKRTFVPLGKYRVACRCLEKVYSHQNELGIGGSILLWQLGTYKKSKIEIGSFGVFDRCCLLLPTCGTRHKRSRSADHRRSPLLIRHGGKGKQSPKLSKSSDFNSATLCRIFFGSRKAAVQLQPLWIIPKGICRCTIGGTHARI